MLKNGIKHNLEIETFKRLTVSPFHFHKFIDYSILNTPVYIYSNFNAGILYCLKFQKHSILQFKIPEC